MIQMADCRLSMAEHNAVNEVLSSGRYIQGERVKRFEGAFAQLVGAQCAVACSSGTTALHLALMASGVGPGDEVLVPAFTFFATAGQVVACGATPVFCDIDPETWLIDLDDAFLKITPRTRAIIPVHIFGNVVTPIELNNFRRLGIHVIYDAAQACGSTFRGEPIGGFPDMTCYSFFPSKNLFGPGEGGAVVTGSASKAAKLELLRNHGSATKYSHECMGYNYRMAEVMAAALTTQIETRFNENISARKSNAKWLSLTIDNISGLQYQRVPINVKHSYNQFCVLVDKNVYGRDRDELQQALQWVRINTAIHYPRGLHKQGALNQRVSLPITEDICSRILAIPVHPGLTTHDIKSICDTLGDLKKVMKHEL